MGWSLLGQSVALACRLNGTTWGTGNVVHLMGWLRWLKRDAERATALEREALGVLWTLGDRVTVAHSLEVLALRRRRDRATRAGGLAIRGDRTATAYDRRGPPAVPSRQMRTGDGGGPHPGWAPPGFMRAGPRGAMPRWSR